MHRQFVSKEFLKFLVVGGLAALINFLSRFLYSNMMSFRWAVLVAYITGMVTAFVLSKLYVFEPSGRKLHHEMSYFAIINVFAVLQVWVISVGLAEYVFPATGFEFYPEAVAHFIGISVPAFTSYLGHKYFSFRKVLDH
jgi:putative flippase GtrA